jgi:hypothetical protein
VFSALACWKLGPNKGLGSLVLLLRVVLERWQSVGEELCCANYFERRSAVESKG